MYTKLARNLELADVKLGTVCFTNKSPGIWYYKKKELLERQKTAVHSRACATLLVLCC